jgi:hypothetical protein
MTVRPLVGWSRIGVASRRADLAVEPSCIRLSERRALPDDPRNRALSNPPFRLVGDDLGMRFTDGC